jgi:thiol:disulfide interchange protein
MKAEIDLRSAAVVALALAALAWGACSVMDGLTYHPPAAPLAPPPAKWQAASYEEAIELAEAQTRPVLAVFSAAWCGPCRQLEKTLADPAVARELRQAYVFVKIDGDQRPDLVRRYGVQAYPTYVLLERGVRTGHKRGTGYKAPGEFLTWLGRP